MRKKCIWLINQNTVPLKYGNFNRHFDISEELVKKGYEVNIIASNFRPRIHKRPPNDKKVNFEVISGINVWWLRGIVYDTNDLSKRVMQWLLFSYRLFFISRYNINKPDIVIASSLPLTVFLNGIYLKWRYGAKLIIDVRDIWPQFLTDMGYFSKYNPLIILMRSVEKLGYRHADYITSAWPKFDRHVSKSIKGDFKFKCVPKGVKPDLLSSENKKELSEGIIKMHFNEKKFIVGYSGLISHSNNLLTFINASKELVFNEGIHFVLMGDGPAKNELIEITSGQANVSFVPSQPKYFVQSFLSRCDLLYSGLNDLDIYHNGTALNKWVEYMLAGKPIVSAFSGYQSLVNESNCGTFVRSKDVKGLVRAIENYSKMPSKELVEIGARGRTWILERRTFDKIADAYIEVFNYLLD